MNLAPMLPAGLAALAAVLLPLLIHLARRSEQRPTPFAALRWLRAKPRPRRRVRFDEWPLLIARLLLLCLLALLLSRPVLHGAPDTRPRVLVAPGIEPAAAREAVTAGDARWHWLARGFPPVEATGSPPRDMPPASPSSLLREFDGNLDPGAPLTVVVPARLDGVDAQRPRLSREVDWRVLPSNGGASQEAPPANAGTARVPAIRFASSHEAAARTLQAAIDAWQPAGHSVAVEVAALSQPLAAGTRQAIWLAAEAVPPALQDWVSAGGTLLVASEAPVVGATRPAVVLRDRRGRPLVESRAMGEGRMLRFTRALTPAAMPELLEGAFPGQLRGVFDAAPRAPARVASVHHRPLAGAPAQSMLPRELSPLVLLLIALVFLIERWMATSARSRVAR